MGRISWIDDDNAPAIDEHVAQLEHFTKSMADGVIDEGELSKQEKNVVAAMKAVEGDLDDGAHEKVTNLLVELTAYNVMATLHEIGAARARKAFDGA